MKQKNYIAGLYFRLSQEDERQGESVSIDNQRTILRKYAEESFFQLIGYPLSNHATIAWFFYTKK